LQYDGVSAALLLVPLAPSGKPVDLTPHAARPGPAGLPGSRRGRQGRP
jgi:hypothetical protein